MKYKGNLLLDSTIIHRCLAGDSTAFTELFEAYKNLVFRTAFLILDSADDAEDVLQDVFIEVHHSLNRYDPARGAFSTWLYSITVNKCLNRRRHWTFFTTSLDEVAEKNFPATAITDGERADIESVRKAIGLLSVKLRAVVVLRFYWGLSYAEMSKILDLPLGTIKSCLNLAMRTLQTTLKDEMNPAFFSIKEESK